MNRGIQKVYLQNIRNIYKNFRCCSSKFSRNLKNWNFCCYHSTRANRIVAPCWTSYENNAKKFLPFIVSYHKQILGRKKLLKEEQKRKQNDCRQFSFHWNKFQQHNKVQQQSSSIMEQLHYTISATSRSK